MTRVPLYIFIKEISTKKARSQICEVICSGNKRRFTSWVCSQDLNRLELRTLKKDAQWYTSGRRQSRALRLVRQSETTCRTGDISTWLTNLVVSQRLMKLDIFNQSLPGIITIGNPSDVVLIGNTMFSYFKAISMVAKERYQNGKKLMLHTWSINLASSQALRCSIRAMMVLAFYAPVYTGNVEGWSF